MGKGSTNSSWTPSLECGIGMETPKRTTGQRKSTTFPLVRFSGPTSCTSLTFKHEVCMCVRCVHTCGSGRRGTKHHHVCVPSSPDSICRYNYWLNTAKPYYVALYDLLAKKQKNCSCSLHSTFPSKAHFLPCFITGKWYRRWLYFQTIKHGLAQIPSWNIKQNECRVLPCVYHVTLKAKT